MMLAVTAIPDERKGEQLVVLASTRRINLIPDLLDTRWLKVDFQISVHPTTR